jgi:23S rRNA (uracil1939-C5)-methyltransferase
VVLVLPDKTAANLVGENYLVQSVNGHDFRVSAGCFFYPSLQAAELLVEVVLRYAALSGRDKVLELFSGIGTLTAFLASAAAEVVGIESNPDAVADAAVNLNGYSNVALYEGRVETILPLLDVTPDVVIAHPLAAGLMPTIVDEIGRFGPDRFVYVSSDVATMARDSKRLTAAGYRLVELQPIDMLPQNFQTQTVSLWTPA